MATIYVRNAGGTPTQMDIPENIATTPIETGDIGDGQVTNAKLADMPTKTYKGRTSGGTGDPENVPAATVRADIEAERLGVIRGVNLQGSAYTLQLTDAGQVVEGFNGSDTAFDITVPTDASAAFPVGAYINFTSYLTAGKLRIVAAGGVNLRTYNGAAKFAGVNATATIYKRAANDWVLSGNLVA